jgi:SpoVK/Ycf46/Vps4 family AAA+-type ATPase
MALLEGPPGTGKTLSISAFTRALHEDVSAITGIPLEELPPLVMRIKVGAVLSEWLGRSDKNLDRVFDEAEQLASEELVGPDGRVWPRPVLILFEEVESLARTRGSDHEAVYDRIQTTLLQRLDPGAGTLADRLLIVIGTTNVGNLVDRAFVRRIGGVVERFGHLDRRGCEAVLDKQLGRRPVAARNGDGQRAARARLVADLTAWLFGPNAEERAQVELSIAGRAQAQLVHRRDFLTGGLLDRAVQDAAREAIQLELQGVGSGLSRGMLALAIDRQVRAIVERLDEKSVRQYLPLEDGVLVTAVRRVPQPAQLAIELDRSA